MRNLVAWLVAILGTGLFFWPVLQDPVGRIAGGGGDPLLVTYLFTWVGDTLGSPEVWHPPFLFPDNNVLTYSDHLLAFGALSWGLSLLGLAPAAQFNLFTLLGFAGVFLGLFLWIRESLAPVVPSLAAAALATFTAYRWDQVGHLQVHCLPLFVFALWGLERGRRSGRVLPLWWAGLALALQILATPSMALFFLPVAALWILFSTLLRVSPGWTRTQWVHLVSVAVTVVVVQLPWILRYRTVHAERGLSRPLTAILEFSARPIDWISASPSHWLYGDLLAFTQGFERELFPGTLVTLLAVTALVHVFVRGRHHRFALAASLLAVICLLLMNGPSASGRVSLAHLPYDLLSLVPGMDSVRVPTRFFGLAGFFLVPALAVLFGRWEGGASAAGRRQIRRRDLRRIQAGTIALTAIAIVEALPSFAPWDHLDATRLRGPDPLVPRASAERAVLFLPLPEERDLSTEIRRMWKARALGVATVNGYSGYSSAVHQRLRGLQSTTLVPSERSALYSWLRHLGVTQFRLEAGGSHPFLEDGDRASRGHPTANSAGADGSGDTDAPTNAPGHTATIDIPVGAVPEVSSLPLDSPLFEMTHGHGWSFREQDESDRWIWAVGGHSQLWIPVVEPGDRTLFIRAYTLAKETEAELTVQWNGRKLGRRNVPRAAGWVEIFVPEAVQREGWNDVLLLGPTPIRPADRQKSSTDRRPLSLCVYEILLDSDQKSRRPTPDRNPRGAPETGRSGAEDRNREPEIGAIGEEFDHYAVKNINFTHIYVKNRVD